MEFTRPEKDPRPLVQHGEREDLENGRVWKWVTRDAREDFPNDRNGNKFNKGEKDY